MVQKANIDHGRYCLHYQFDAEEIEGAVLDGPFEDRDVCGDPSPEVALLVVNRVALSAFSRSLFTSSS